MHSRHGLLFSISYFQYKSYKISSQVILANFVRFCFIEIQFNAFYFWGIDAIVAGKNKKEKKEKCMIL